jgi:1-acylglycerone phosphate reductase
MPRSVLITGCSAGGIGSALVDEFHARGLHVYATARSAAKMSHLKQLPTVTLLELDITDQSSIEAAVQAVHKDTGGKLDILFNNAGQSMVFPALDTSIDDSKKLFDANLWGTMAITQAFAPFVIAAGGSIVNVCSISGFLYAPWMGRLKTLHPITLDLTDLAGLADTANWIDSGVYNASKAALMSWSETLRLELEPFGVRVVSLVTGSVATNVMSHAELRLPATSLYQKAIPEIQKRGVGEDVQSKSSPAGFAQAVVGDILGGATSPLWRGAMASAARIMSSFLPTSVVVSCPRACRLFYRAI